MKRHSLKLTLGIFALCAHSVFAAPPSVAFIEPLDGAVVTSPFVAKFSVSGMSVREAEDMTPNTGHFHVLINSEHIKPGRMIPYNDKHLHFGKGQTETTLTLPPGKHTLTLQFGNGVHKSYGPEMSHTITITVQ